MSFLYILVHIYLQLILVSLLYWNTTKSYLELVSSRRARQQLKDNNIFSLFLILCQMEEAYLFSIRYFHHELDPSYGTSKGFLIYDLHLHCYRLQATHKILPVRNPGFLSTIYWPLVFNGKIAQKLCLPLKDSYILLILSILRI